METIENDTLDDLYEKLSIQRETGEDCTDTIQEIINSLS